MLLTWCLLFELVRIRLTAMRLTARPKMLFMSLSLAEFDPIPNLEMAHEIWSILERYHKVTSHVKTNLFETHHREYENFVQLHGESVDSMFSRFQSIVNKTWANKSQLPYDGH